MSKKTWKGVFAALASAVALLAGSATAQAALCGDLNNNGSRNVADVVLLFRAVLENPDPTPLCGGAGVDDCGDIVDDGAISVNDVVVLFSSVLGNETLFALCSGPGTTIACPGGEVVIGSNITTNQVWPSSCKIYLNGTIFVEPNVVLTIQAGTTVRGQKNPTNPPPSALVFRRDAKINAVGSSGSPIVFTSDQDDPFGAGAPGPRGPGDWGGLSINGRSTVNCPGDECLAEGLTGVPFGGNEVNDSSGILRFARISFAGRILSVDNELNVLTLNGVGKGTTIDHVQAHMGLDDGVEWFGGEVNMKHVVSTGAADDMVDWQLGTRANVQYLWAAQYGGNLDVAGSNGFEGDNNENGLDLLERSAPKFCNVTVIGCEGQSPGANCTVDSAGALIRRGTDMQLWKSIVTNFGNRGMQLRDNATAIRACTGTGPWTLTGNVVSKDTIFYDNGAGAPGTVQCANHSSTTGTNCKSCDLYALWTSQASGPVVELNPGINGAVFPPARIPTMAANVNSAATDCKTGLDSFFDTTTYRGSHDPAGADWTSPWADFAVN